MLNLNYNIILTSKQEYKGPNQYQIRPDPFSGSIVLAVPGNLFLNGQGKSQFGQINDFDDISAYVRGTGVASGSNLTITPSASLNPLSASIWATSSYVKFDNNQDRYNTSMYLAGESSLVTANIWPKGEGINFTASKDWCIEYYAGYAQTGSTVLIPPPNPTNAYEWNPKRTTYYKYTPGSQISSSFYWDGIWGGDIDAGIGDLIVSGSSKFYYTIYPSLNERNVLLPSSSLVGNYSWNHYAVSYTSNTRTIRLFVNGMMAQTANIATDSDFNYTPNENLQFAGAVDADWSQGSYSGSQFIFQDFRVYNGSNKDYTSSFTPPPSMVTWG